MALYKFFILYFILYCQHFLFLSGSCRFRSRLLVAFFAGLLSSLTCVIFLHTVTSWILLLIWSLSSGPSPNGYRLLSSMATKLVWHILSVVLHILCKWLRILPCLLTIPNTLFALDTASAHCLETLKSAVVTIPRSLSSSTSCSVQYLSSCLIVYFVGNWCRMCTPHQRKEMGEKDLILMFPMYTRRN